MATDKAGGDGVHFPLQHKRLSHMQGKINMTFLVSQLHRPEVWVPGLDSLLRVSHSQSRHQQVALSAESTVEARSSSWKNSGPRPCRADVPSFVALSWASALEGATFLATVPFISNQQRTPSSAAAPNLSD